MSSSSESAAGKGTDSPGQFLLAKQVSGILGGCRAAFSPSLGAGGREKVCARKYIIIVKCRMQGTLGTGENE